jgi:uncharacterized protein YceH (UPF0502 family)
MAELSATNLVLIDLDPDSGDPSGLKVGLVGDTIASSILTRNIRNVVSAVEDTSATWDEGGDPSAAGFENWNDTSTVVATSSNFWNQSRDAVLDNSATWDSHTGASAAGFENWNSTSATVNTFSGSVETSTATLDTSTDALNVFSGSVETSTATLDTSTDALNVFSGSVDTSVVTLDTSTDALNTFSGSVETSTATLDTSTDALNVFSGSVDTSTAILDTSTDALNVFSGSVDTSVVTLDSDITAIDTRVGTVESQVPSAVGFSDWNRTRDYVTAASAGLDDVLDTSADWDEARTTISTFSGNMETSTAGLSALVDASTAILDTSTDALNVFSGSVDTSVVTLDTSTDALNVFSGSVETSTTTIDGRVVTVEAQVPSATGFAGWDSTETTVDNGASNWDTIYGDRANIQSISGTVGTSATAFLTGATPTATVSAITVSSCPVPAPWSFVAITDDEQTKDSSQTDYYWGSAVGGEATLPAKTNTEFSPELISWDNTGMFFTVATAGYYELICRSSVQMQGTSAAKVTFNLSSAPLGGGSVSLIQKANRVAATSDPEGVIIHWMGYLLGGTKVVCHISVGGGEGAVMFKGSTFTCKRIN